MRQLPEVDILVNNLGIFEPKPFEEIPDEDWLRFFETNVMSGVRLTRHYLPGMRRKDWGRIVFVSSESGVQIPAEMIHYGMTKTAQLAIARGVAESVAGTGITVNSVLPGPTESEGVAKFVADLARQRGVDRSVVESEFFQTARPTSLLEAVRHGGGGGEHDRLRVQSAGLGHQRGGPSGRWRRSAVDRLSRLPRACHVLPSTPPQVLRPVGCQRQDDRHGAAVGGRAADRLPRSRRACGACTSRSPQMSTSV